MHHVPLAVHHGDPRLAALQIAVIQAGYYVVTGAALFLLVPAMVGRPPTLASLFAAAPGNTDALAVVLAHVVAAPASAWIVGETVTQPSQVADHVLTLGGLHLLLRWLLFGFPRTVTFWVALGLDAFLLIAAGEVLARRREMAELRRATESLTVPDDAAGGTGLNNNRGAVAPFGGGASPPPHAPNNSTSGAVGGTNSMGRSPGAPTFGSSGGGAGAHVSSPSSASPAPRMPLPPALAPMAAGQLDPVM
jgi:hypothetical protein